MVADAKQPNPHKSKQNLQHSPVRFARQLPAGRGGRQREPSITETLGKVARLNSEHDLTHAWTSAHFAGVTTTRCGRFCFLDISFPDPTSISTHPMDSPTTEQPCFPWTGGFSICDCTHSRLQCNIAYIFRHSQANGAGTLRSSAWNSRLKAGESPRNCVWGEQWRISWLYRRQRWRAVGREQEQRAG